jgi:plastocyanin
MGLNNSCISYIIKIQGGFTMKAIHIIAILAILLLVGCAKQAVTPTSQTPVANTPTTPVANTPTTPQQTAPQTPAETPAGPEEIITLSDTTAQPVDVKVAVGGSVTFKSEATNRPHLIIVDELSERSSRLETGNTYTFKFDKAGAYTYRDLWIGSLRGTITVE